MKNVFGAKSTGGVTGTAGQQSGAAYGLGRKIPATMATQHPDNALAPYWDKYGRPFIGAHQEINEAMHCFNDLNVSEYMWDWEGKHADAAVIDRLFTEQYKYFSEHCLGKDKFLTFRVPNIWEEKGYNLLQAMTVILSAEDFARDLNFSTRPLFEVILPMTERANQVMRMHVLFERLAHFKSKDFTKKEPDNTDYLEVIPLVESAEGQMRIGEIFDEYIRLHTEHFGQQPRYIRAFLACSDSALSASFLSGIIGNKLALSKLYEFSERSGVSVFPIAGAGSLTFRGGLSPETIDRFLTELPGVRTVTVQSSFRYDHPIEEVKKAIERLETELPKSKPRLITSSAQTELSAIAKISKSHYTHSLAGIIPDMQAIFKAVPKRRDRRQHIGLLAYNRNFAGQELPRAITFTGGFYSIGLPPEFIGLGRTLSSLTSSQLETLLSEYPSLTSDMERAGRFINRDNLKALADVNKAWQDIEKDVRLCEEVLNISFDPKTKDEINHQTLSAKILTKKNDPSALAELITLSGEARKSIG